MADVKVRINNYDEAETSGKTIQSIANSLYDDAQTMKDAMTNAYNEDGWWGEGADNGNELITTLFNKASDLKAVVNEGVTSLNQALQFLRDSDTQAGQEASMTESDVKANANSELPDTWAGRAGVTT